MPTNDSVYHVKLGATITDYHMDDTRLFVSGDAIAEGVWTGVDGVPRFYPKEVLQEATPLFNNIPLVCEHRGLKIGEVVRVESTELGFRIAEGYITDPTSIQAVMSGRKTGFSIEGLINVDPITSIVEKIISADNISLVTDPACRVCGIDNAHYMNSGEDTMTEKVENSAPEAEVVEPIVEESAEPIVEEPVIQEASVADIPAESNGFFDELKLAAMKFVDIYKKFTGTEQPSTVIEEAPVDTVVETSEPIIESIETPIEPIIEPIIETQTAPQFDHIAMSENIANTATRIEELTTALAAANEVIKQYGVQLEALTTTVQTLTVQKMELAAKESEACAELIGQIKELDPDTDDTLVSGMTSMQLASYKSKVESLAKPTVGGTKSSVPRNVTVEQKNVETYNKEESLRKIAKFLKGLETK